MGKVSPRCPKTNKSCGYAYRYLNCRCDACRAFHASQAFRDVGAAERSRLWRLNNGERSRETARQYARTHPDKVFELALRKYGLTPFDYRAMLLSQGMVCAICKKEETDMWRYKRLAVDHCKNTHKVRGLLCSQCNTGIGKLRHSPDVLRRAADYLDAHGGAANITTLYVSGAI